MGEFQLRFQKKKDQDEFGQMLNDMNRDAKKDPLGDFEVMFSRMHHGFFEKLLTTSPELTKAELQMCALLRMNLSSKEISRLLNLTVATIDVTRSHIRKKLKLDQSQSLTSYLIMLG
jgi:DNA-binding CsgD family transcriptional regulator